MKNTAVKFLLIPALLPVSATVLPTAVILLDPGAAYGQTYRGGIAGTVVDATGAGVPNAKVVLLSPDTGFTRTQQSTGSGGYAFQDLPVGSYTVSVEAPGFSATKVEKIAVRPGEVYSLDPKLGVSEAMRKKGVKELPVQGAESARAMKRGSSRQMNELIAEW